MNLAYDFVNLRKLQEAEEAANASSWASLNEAAQVVAAQTVAAQTVAVELPDEILSQKFEQLADALSETAKAVQVASSSEMDKDTYLEDHLQISMSYRLLEPVSRNPYRLSRKS